MRLLEICCYSPECAWHAAQAGADRIELCASVKEGGITPSYGTLKLVASQLSVPVHPIVRPRAGDFCYQRREFAAILQDIALIRDLGFPGFVTGLLLEDGSIDLLRMRQIMQAAGGLAVTFHRAFDLCREPMQALTQLTDLGVSRILTSGQQPVALQGLELLIRLTQQSRGPIIMAGAGVRYDNIRQFMAAGIRELHSSAGSWQPSPMYYRHPAISLSADTKADEYQRYQLDMDSVRKMKQVLCEN